MRKSMIILIILAAVVGLGYVYLQSRVLTTGEEYLPDSKVIERLKVIKVHEKDGVYTFDDARMERRDGNIILHLKGSPYEMGYQHGILLKDDIREGVVPIFADPISHVSEYRDKPAWMRKLLLKYLEFAVYAPVERNTPQEYLEELKGIADGCGLDYKTIFIANFKSDLAMAMMPKVIEKRAGDLGLTVGCSSFAVSGPATLDGKLIFGRNTDYSGQGRWGHHQTIVFYEPKDNYSYVKVSTAGLIKCNSAMNEMGLVIGGHFMGFSGSSPEGVSFTILENEIMRKAKNIKEAIGILKEHHLGGTFGFLIADSKSRDAVAIEATDDVMGIRAMEGGSICLTNFATTPELKKVDLVAKYNLVMRDMVGRYTRLEELIKENYGRITPAVAAEFMGDHLDIVAGKERGTGITICASNNVTSVVFLPEEGFFWVATGVGPACSNRYIGFDFWAEIKGERPDISPEVLSGYQWKNKSHKQGLMAFMEAYIAYEQDPRDTEQVLFHLGRARDVDPQEPIYNRMIARLLIHQGDYHKAIELLHTSLNLPQSPNESALTHLLLAQAYDLEGKREDALSMYQKVMALRGKYGRDYLLGINDMVCGFAQKGINSPFTTRDIHDISIGFHTETGLE